MKFFLSLGLTAAATTMTLLTGQAAFSQTPAALAELELTPEQQADIQTLVTDLKTDLGEILTPEQQEQFQTAYTEQQDLRQAMGSIDTLSNGQKQSLRALGQDFRAEVQGILTPEQQAELRSTMPQRPRRR